MSYTNPDGSPDTIESLTTSARLFAITLGRILQEDEGMVVELKFQPSFPEDRTGKYMVFKEKGQIKIKELEPGDELYESQDGQLFMIRTTQ